MWDSGITDLTGDLRHGGNIWIRSIRGGNRTFRLRVDLMDESMTWTSRGPAGLYQGIRTVIITPEGAKTHLLVTVTFTGPLHRVPARMFPETDGALQNYVAAVRHRAELLDRAG